jgi:Tfp pilus assembly protein PilO
MKSVPARARIVADRNAAVLARLDDLRAASRVLETLDAALRSNQSAFDTLRMRLPQSPGMGDFLANLDRTARNNGLELSTVQPGSVVREEWCVRTPVSFTCRGAFANLHTFLFQLENMERLVRVEELTISGGGRSEPRMMTVSCSVYGR